jgi:hypothetical protein
MLKLSTELLHEKHMFFNLVHTKIESDTFRSLIHIIIVEK